MNNPAIQTLIGHLDQSERNQVADLLQYMTSVATSPNGHVPEGSIATLLNKQSPRVREVFSTLSKGMETPRIAPFDHKHTEAEWAQVLGLDPSVAQSVKAALDGQEVAATLQKKMGTDTGLPQGPITHKEVLEAAYDLHNRPDPFERLSNEANHLTRRETIGRIGDFVAQNVAGHDYDASISHPQPVEAGSMRASITEALEGKSNG